MFGETNWLAQKARILHWIEAVWIGLAAVATGNCWVSCMTALELDKTDWTTVTENFIEDVVL